jgi:hypothetical protein
MKHARKVKVDNIDQEIITKARRKEWRKHENGIGRDKGRRYYATGSLQCKL